MNPLIVLFNPSSGSGRSAKKENLIRKKLGDFKIKFDFIRTDSEEHLLREASKAAEKNIDIITVGGDTSFSLVANRIIDASGSSSRLGMIGTGSANDIPVGMGCGDIIDVLNAVKNNKTKEMDIVSLIINRGKSIFFLGTLSIGLGVSVNRYLESFKSRHPKLLRYIPFFEPVFGAIGVRKTFASGDVPVNAVISSDQYVGPVKFSLMVFLNTPLFSRGLALSKNSSPFDGNLDCAIINTESFTSTLKLMLSIKRGTQSKKREIKLIKSSSIKIEFDVPVGIQYDGEIINGVKIMNISVGERSLNVFCP